MSRRPLDSTMKPACRTTWPRPKRRRPCDGDVRPLSVREQMLEPARLRRLDLMAQKQVMCIRTWYGRSTGVEHGGELRRIL